MRSKILTGVVVGLLLSGCATIPEPSEAEIANADYGDVPDKNNLAVLEGYLSAYLHLRDPYSAVWDFTSVKARTVIDGKWYYGYQVYPSVNAKNGYGGYTGTKGIQPAFVHFKGQNKMFCFDQKCFNR